VKREVIRWRGYLHIEFEHEDVAAFEYTPTACDSAYRMIVVRKNITKRSREILFSSMNQGIDFTSLMNGRS
jgi:hypothetical protein